MLRRKYNLDKSTFAQLHSMGGSMLIELLLSVALTAVAMPFLFRYQENAVRRAENVGIAQQMSQIQSVLERYIVENREDLLKTVGRNIVRIDLSDLVPFGLSESVLESKDKYQVRVLKSLERSGQSTLQGIVVFASNEITPLRTREIVSLGGGNMGFIEGNHAYGNFGAWHANTADFGVSLTDGIVSKTSVNRNNALYLWRVPSDNVSDATMQSSLNLGGHDIEDIMFLNAASAQFEETLKLGETAATTTIFKNRTTIDNDFKTNTSVVAGTLSADSRTMEIAGTLNIADLGKFSALNTADLWVNKLTLSGLSISSDADVPVLKINQSLNMISGRVDAMFVTVGFSGSITPRLVVNESIEDSINSSYYWNVKDGNARMFDITLKELNRMASVIISNNKTLYQTSVYQIFNSVVANKNATVADYMNAINEIQRTVRSKYHQLNLE